MERFSREEQLIGREGLLKLQGARVAVFGAGGVGGSVIETLARAGVGALDIIDPDEISLSNCNRQLLALESTLGKNKALAAKERVLDINPACKVTALPLFFTGETAGFDFSRYSYVVDAIDTVSSKLSLIAACKRAGTPVITCMGTGNKLDPGAFRVAEVEKTSVCPLARVMRRELKRLGITGVKAVYSTEPPWENHALDTKGNTGHPAPGSISYGPAAAGLLLAAQVIRELLGINRGKIAKKC